MRNRRNKWKVLVMCFVLFAAVLLEPVSYARADEGLFNSELPYLQGIEVELQRNDSWHSTGLIFGSVDKQRSIAFVNFEFDQLSVVDYTKYELVFDFELASQLEDGSIKTYQYIHVSDIGKNNEPGFFNNLLISLSLKDDYFKQSFSYPAIIKNSPDFLQTSESSMAAMKGLNSYNTVISRVDCYLKEKSTGNYGLKSRFIFTWEEDFWNQLCSGISYQLLLPETGEVLESDGISNSLFAGGFDSDGENTYEEVWSILSRVSEFLVDIPAAIVALLSGFFNLALYISSLFKAVFPFFPGFIFDFFGVVLFVTPAVAIWLIVKGK